MVDEVEEEEEEENCLYRHVVNLVKYYVYIQGHPGTYKPPK